MEKEWSRRAGRRHLGDGAHANTTAPTVSSSNKTVSKSGSSKTPNAKPSAAPIPPSRWKDLRQSVRIKATMDTEERRMKNAKIADLCAEDRDKVAKLIRRIVEVHSQRHDIGTLQEESELEFHRQRDVLDTEIKELREQVKRDADEMEDLSDKLKATLLKLRDYQERVLVLEESNEVEARYRMETDQTMDLLKLEVEKLRTLVRKQKEEMELKDQEEQRKLKQEIERVSRQLKDAQEELLRERRERITEKQKEFDERLQKAMASSVAAASEVAQTSESLRSVSSSQVARETPNGSAMSIPPPMPPQLDMSSFLNTSIELPAKIKEIMDEWKERMEDAIAGTARSIAEQPESKVVQTALEAHQKETASDEDSDEDDMEEEQQSRRFEQKSRTHPSVQKANRSDRNRLHLVSVPEVKRRQFDKYLRIESDSESQTRADGDVDDAEEKESDDCKKEGHLSMRTKNRARSGSRHRRDHTSKNRSHPRQHQRTHADSFGESNPSSRESDHKLDSEDDEEADGSEVALMDSINNRSFVNGVEDTRRVDSFSSLYESSLFDVVDAIEGAAFPKAGAARGSSRQNSSHLSIHTHRNGFQPHRDSPQMSAGTTADSSSSSRFRDLLQGIRAREQKLARLDGQVPSQSPPQHETRRSHHETHHQNANTGDVFNADDDDDFAIFHEVKDLYEQDVFESRQRTRSPGASVQSANRTDQSSPRQRQFEGGGDAGSLGPPLSAQDLSLREAIEKDMAELLQEEAVRDLSR